MDKIISANITPRAIKSLLNRSKTKNTTTLRIAPKVSNFPKLPCMRIIWTPSRKECSVKAAKKIKLPRTQVAKPISVPYNKSIFLIQFPGIKFLYGIVRCHVKMNRNDGNISLFQRPFISILTEVLIDKFTS